MCGVNNHPNLLTYICILTMKQFQMELKPDDGGHVPLFHLRWNKEKKNRPKNSHDRPSLEAFLCFLASLFPLLPPSPLFIAAQILISCRVLEKPSIPKDDRVARMENGVPILLKVNNNKRMLEDFRVYLRQFGHWSNSALYCTIPAPYSFSAFIASCAAKPVQQLSHPTRRILRARNRDRVLEQSAFANMDSERNSLDW